MKEMKVLATLCALALTASSQPYGQMTYTHTDPCRLTCGKLLSLNPGFIMAGVVPSIPNSGPLNFYIDKTDVGGSLSGSSFFAAGYQIIYDPLCGTSFNQELQCFGVDVVEASDPSFGATYYTAAATENGCWFMGLDTYGNRTPGLQQGLIFPSGVTNITCPKIVESQDNPGDYYVAGSYYAGTTGIMYIFKVSSSGNIYWNKTYDTGALTGLEPGAIIESPYAPPGYPELAVFGTWYTATLNYQGFVMVIDANNSTGGNTVLKSDHYGQPTGANEDRFCSAAVANASTPGFPGYIIGGVTDVNTPNGYAWMLKIPYVGSSVIWSNVYQSSLDPSAGRVVGIMERYSSAYLAYEYYGAVISAYGMMVMKVDQSGIQFNQPSSPNNPNNEFVYTVNSSPQSAPCSISYQDIGSNDIGIHVYGTDNSGTGSFHLVEAYFNGITGCSTSNENISTSLQQSTGPGYVGSFLVTVSTGNSTCTAFDFSPAGSTTFTNQVCGGNASVGGGINLRGAATGVTKNQAPGDRLSVFPNPANNRIELSASGNSGSPVTMELTNALGQFIAPAITGTFDNDGYYHTIIDFEALGVNAGVYFVRFVGNGTDSKQKILYTK